MLNSLDKLAEKLVAVGGRTSVAALAIVTGILMVLFIPPIGVLNGNEEYYFQLAYSHVHPDFPAGHSAVIGSRGHMLFFLLPFGYLIDAVGYSAAQIITRVVIAALYTVALVRLFRNLGVRVLDALVVLVVFYFFGQQILGGEWLFDGAEAKSLAYPMLLLAFAFHLEGRAWPAVVAGAVATYFHFLAGGFWMGLLFLAALWSGTPLLTVIRHGVVYTLLCAPLLVAVVGSYGSTMVGPPPAADLPPMAWITGIFRNASLTAPFSSVWQFVSWAPRIGFLFGLWVVSFFLLRSAREPQLLLARLCVLSLSYLVLALALSGVLAALGKDHVLAAVFPFRPSSLALFLFLLVAVDVLRRIFDGNPARDRVLLAVAFVTAAFIAPLLADRSVVNLIRYDRQVDRQAELAEFISTATAPDDIFVVHEKLEGEFWTFQREVGRPVYSFRKFTSVDKQGVYEWFIREKDRSAISAKGCEVPLHFPADFLLAPANYPDGLVRSCGALVYADANYLLIRLAEPVGDKAPAQ